MLKMFMQKPQAFFYFLLLAALICGGTYGAGRLYFHLTDGFALEHISSDFSYDPRWTTRPLNEAEEEQVRHILSEEFTYLGKGCQSYVFLSKDKKYVLKFFKYQRFRPQFYLDWFSFLPGMDAWLEEKIKVKTRKREKLFSSWKLAFDHLQDETGLVYVHLNKSGHLNTPLTIYDKMGKRHLLDPDRMEFLIQKKADMLCTRLNDHMARGQVEEAKLLLERLVQRIVGEYRKGFADHDHALMQNTGVYGDVPIHIDVGQFEANPRFQDPGFYYQELFNKTWKFRQWLRDRYPELLKHLEDLLINEMGGQFYEIEYIPKVH